MKKILIITLSVFAISCNCKKNICKNTEVSSVSYKFVASSVAPKDHRSYELLVKPYSISVMVNSYGTILTDTTINISKDYYYEIIEFYKSLNLQKTDVVQNNGCMGGTSGLVKASDKSEKIIFDGYTHFCGGLEFGNINGDIKSIDKKIRSYISNFETLLKKEWAPDFKSE